MPAGDAILLVNDIPDHAVAYGHALTKHGFKVHLVHTAKDAIELVHMSKPDCTVIDLRLPDMSGWDLCRKLKTQTEAHGMPIVVLTPDLSKMCAQNSAKVGCDAWLAHPAVADDLVRTVRRVLDLETVAPLSPEDALLSFMECAACGSDQVRPTLRMNLIQHYCCKACGFCWRVEVLAASRAG